MNDKRKAFFVIYCFLKENKTNYKVSHFPPTTLPIAAYLPMWGGGGSGPSRANKFLYAPAPPPPSVWALKPPS